jgi:hypothetical protein
MNGSHSHPNKKSHLFSTRGTICCLASLAACCLGIGEEVGRLGPLGGLVLEVYVGSAQIMIHVTVFKWGKRDRLRVVGVDKRLPALPEIRNLVRASQGRTGVVCS